MLFIWLAITDDVATAPPPPPALPTLPIVVGRGTTPADVGTTGASPKIVEPAFEIVTAAVAAVGDERGRLQMLLIAEAPDGADNDKVLLETVETVVAVAADVVADSEEIVDKLLVILRPFAE